MLHSIENARTVRKRDARRISESDWTLLGGCFLIFPRDTINIFADGSFAFDEYEPCIVKFVCSFASIFQVLLDVSVRPTDRQLVQRPSRGFSQVGVQEFTRCCDRDKDDIVCNDRAMSCLS